MTASLTCTPACFAANRKMAGSGFEKPHEWLSVGGAVSRGLMASDWSTRTGGERDGSISASENHEKDCVT